MKNVLYAFTFFLILCVEMINSMKLLGKKFIVFVTLRYFVVK